MCQHQAPGCPGGRPGAQGGMGRRWNVGWGSENEAALKERWQHLCKGASGGSEGQGQCSGQVTVAQGQQQSLCVCVRAPGDCVLLHTHVVLCLFFKIVLFICKAERERERQRYCLSAGSFPKWPQRPGLARLKPGTPSSSVSLIWVQGLEPLGLLPLFSRSISRELGQKWGCWDVNRRPCDARIAGGGVAPCATVPAPVPCLRNDGDHRKPVLKTSVSCLPVYRTELAVLGRLPPLLSPLWSQEIWESPHNTNLHFKFSKTDLS